MALVTAALVPTGRAEGQKPPRFAAQAELVIVDVVVLGPDGKPPNPVPDGRFRRIQAKVTRPGVRVRTRAGYFAAPATPTVAAFELTLIAALAQDDPPRAFPHEVRLVPHGSKDEDREVELLAEVPLDAIEIASDATRGTYTAHLSFVAFIKDQTGRPVVRLGQDWPVERKLDEGGRVPQESLVLRRALSLPPGGTRSSRRSRTARPGVSACPARRSTSHRRRPTHGEGRAIRTSARGTRGAR